MDIRVERNKCCGFGMCTELAPTLFDLDDADGLAHVLVEQPGPEHEQAVAAAVAQCPTGAISVTRR